MVFTRALSTGVSAPDSSTFHRASTRVSSLFTFWPPGPLECDVRISISWSGIRSRFKGEYLLLDRLRRDHHLAPVHEKVHFAPHPEVLHVDPRLHRHERSIRESPVVAGLEIVEMHAVSMHLLADRMPRPVDEAIAVAETLDHRARRVIHLAAPDRPTGTERPAHKLDRGVPRVTNRREDGPMALGRRDAHVGNLGVVGVDRSRSRPLGPGVDKKVVSSADRAAEGRRIHE